MRSFNVVNCSRRAVIVSFFALAAILILLFPIPVTAQTDPLPSWNEGPAKQAIIKFVHATTDPSSPSLVPPLDRIATFDQDGTLWVEHPLYSQLVYCLDRVPALVKAKPELADVEPFKTVLSGDREAIAKLPKDDLLKILAATLTGMSVDQFQAEAKSWLETAKNPRWKRPYTELVYQPMSELLEYLRDNGYRTYIVTGGGQDFVRVYSEATYGIPPEQVVGSAGGTKYGYDKDGKPFLTKEPKLLLNDNDAGKPEGIHLMIGRRPTQRSAIRRVTGRCWNTLKPARASGSPCWCCTTTTSVSTPMVRQKVCPTLRSEPLHKSWMTRPRTMAGSSSA